MLERTGLTHDETDAAAWTAFDDADGQMARVGGARAVALALAVGRDARWPTLPWKIPGMGWLLDRAYRLVATNRHRLPGEQPWCHAHPDECIAASR